MSTSEPRDRPADLGVDRDEVAAPRPPEAARERTPTTVHGLATTFAIGGAMGTADLVPGFSGGTVALVSGIYPRLIANVRQGARAASLLVRLRVRDAVRALAAIEWAFLGALLVGMGTLIVLLAATLRHLLETYPTQLSAVFFGLVAGATVVAVRELRDPAPIHLAVAVPVAVVTFAGLGLRSGSVVDPALLVFAAAGAVAVCAMILPGVSGSFLLLLLGMYEHVIAAVDDREVVVLLAVAAGGVVGLAGASTLLNWLLRRYHDLVLAALIGLMAGSARVLWPWPADEGVGDTRLGAPVADEAAVVALLALVAAVVVVGLALLARRAVARG